MELGMSLLCQTLALAKFDKHPVQLFWANVNAKVETFFSAFNNIFQYKKQKWVNECLLLGSLINVKQFSHKAEMQSDPVSKVMDWGLHWSKF